MGLVQTMVMIALALWSALGSMFTVPDIQVHDSSTSDNVDFREYERIWAAWTYVAEGSCVIWVPPVWQTYPAQLQQKIITHEVGHCLWLNHIEGEGIMGTGEGYELSAADRMEMWRVHPPLFRVYVPF